MESSGHTPSVRAEHDSLPAYLEHRLTEEQLARPLIFTASQWDICTAAVTEIAATMHQMSLDVSVAFWSNKTPMRDVGWTTSHRLASAAFSPARDQRARSALINFGLPRSAFPQPPIKHWRPRGKLPEPEHLTRVALRTLVYRGAPVGGAIVQVPPDNQTPSNDRYEWPKKWVRASIRSYAYVFDQILELIEATNRTHLVVFNGRFLHDAAAVAAAEHSGIPVLFFDYGGNDTDFDLTIDATHDWSALQNRMRVMYHDCDEQERDEVGGRWFRDRRGHTDSSNALFTESQTIGQGIDTPPGKKVVVYFSSSGDEISELDVDWGEYFYGQERALAAVSQACEEIGDTFLVVRTHPHKRFKPRQDVIDWHAAVRAAQPHLHLDEWSEVDSYTLMEQADVVITFGSTTGVEAAYAKRPVIVMGPSAYDELGCAVRVRTGQELKTAIAEARLGDWSGAAAYGLMMNRRGFQCTHLQRGSRMSEFGMIQVRDSCSLVLKASDWVRRRGQKHLGARV